MDTPFFRYWKFLARPPVSAFEQYCPFWHAELVLRHIAYASARLTLGKDAHELLKNVSFHENNLYEIATNKAKNALSEHEFMSDEELPDLLWFATTDDLIKVFVTKKNWERCFSGQLPLSRKDFRTATAKLSVYRNRWAHFRPLTPTDTKKLVGELFGTLTDPIKDWWANYWNADPISKHHPIAEEFAKQNADGIPLGFPEPGHGYTGFIDRDKAIDRGLHLVVHENNTAYWVEPTYHGMRDDFAVDDAIEFSRALRKDAIHVAFVYDLSGERSEITLIQCRVSYSKHDGESAVLNGLKTLRDLLKDRVLRKSPLGTSVIDSNMILEELFYNAPFNVIVAPTTETSLQAQVRIEGDDE